jgi:hypothetical protein
MPKRKPIDYTPQFGSGIFRPKDEVESERTALETTPDLSPTETQGTENTNVLKNERTKERKKVIANEQTKERTLKHHSFDVFIDQLISLDQIQTQIYQDTGKKPKIGELVREALDSYIENRKKEQKKVL